MAKPGSTAKPQTTNNAGPMAVSEGPCPVLGCKTKPKKYGFCETHFDHFKFGLVTKKGEPVSDYDKKFEAYARLQKKLKAA